MWGMCVLKYVILGSWEEPLFQEIFQAKCQEMSEMWFKLELEWFNRLKYYIRI